MECVNAFTDMCIRKGYVSVERAPWLQYALEKRVTSILISIPIIVLGFILAPPAMVISFYFSFYLLRVRTNGFHASSVLRCFLLSLIGVGFFLGVFPKILGNMMEFTLLAVSVILIYKLAPYNHPNMNLTDEESKACAKSAKKRLSILTLLSVALFIMELKQLATGSLLGIVMVAVTLIFAYVPKGERQYEEAETNH